MNNIANPRQVSDPTPFIVIYIKYPSKNETDIILVSAILARWKLNVSNLYLNVLI